jgi:rhamnogalacturonyl hydrolase YesR
VVVQRCFDGADGKPAWYSGKITRREKGSWHVRYDDGDSESFLESSASEMDDLHAAVALAAPGRPSAQNTVAAQNAAAAVKVKLTGLTQNSQVDPEV